MGNVCRKIILIVGQQFILDAEQATDEGDENSVSIDYKNLPNDVKIHDMLLLDDGRVVLQVTAVNGAKIICIASPFYRGRLDRT